MTEFQRTTLTEYLDKLSTTKRKDLSTRRRTRKYIAEKHGFHRQSLHYIERRKAHHFSEAMVGRVVAAVREEAREAGLQFPDGVFIEYLCHEKEHTTSN